ncbi:arsenic transporter [Microbacterium sp. 4R-513]|uniref:SLC13 family permease n=1 Tax=Microbacterium sp. 4R-513 TaxID=2567934 RepID=UPI0013E11CBD|nr:SLC13 family permease [Microbacterium sp. 4R-513]QIG39974.1 arsenic transporter [Microbacterium sp. 4R-513]
MPIAIIGAVLLVVSASAVAFGILPVQDVLAIADRVWPIMLFVVAITIVAELAAAAGVFDVASAFLARVARRRVLLLWLLIVGLAVVSTAFLSLDTTAVLFTPVVVAVARAHRLDPLPFAFTTVWLANTASLVLPVSNLTNLLAVESLDVGVGSFVALMGPSALVAIVVSVAILWIVFHRRLRGRFAPAADPVIGDRLLSWIAGAVVVVLLPLLVSGVPPWMPALGAAVLLILVFAWRFPRALRPALVPWQLLVFVSGLFLAVGAVEAIGGRTVLASLSGSGDHLFALWRLAGIGMLGANGVNNLPAYLALEGVADSPARLGALLVGVNAGPLITPWASLATVLWHSRLTAVGVTVAWKRFMLLGLVAAPLAVAASVVPIAFR